MALVNEMGKMGNGGDQHRVWARRYPCAAFAKATV